MRESFCVTRQPVERQDTSWPVQKQTQSPWSGQECLDINDGGRNKCLCVAVTERITVPHSDIETPGLVAPVNFCVPPSFPLYTLICHTNIHKSFPLHFPVAASSQALSTQYLALFIKSLWVIRIWLLLFSKLHFPVALRQEEVFINCVGIICEITGILVQMLWVYPVLFIMLHTEEHRGTDSEKVPLPWQSLKWTSDIITN